MTTIGFIRHGQTAWNKEGRVQGSSNVPLNEEGIESAEKLANRLADQQWDMIFTSPMNRAKHTAKLIASRMPDVSVEEDSRVRERSSGLIEGTTEQERVQKWGPGWRGLDMQFESAESVIARGLDFVEEQTNINPDKRILVVSHGSFIKRMIAVLLEDEQYAVTIENTSLTVIEVENKTCTLLNCTAHLTGGANGD
ncbi:MULTISPECIES: histidine phosphatase family protein [unclassified Sporosarcina]|uniref:histidine phosphatase family protein n=1 Tax=unclassified Sporosarcina TaxID=2647733 RepID=UPI00203FBA1D|nr:MULTISPECIES: histidine phosphatase family protein [unclassified Sporosarcina]GKV65298.1 fructose 1,6-bisphosphatase [Sporosarcina sp. NCCP-2331]GLB55422.1 fructose 1,6-bisphosphatase [Sporosarcina sp. NCCP-2378]